VLEWLLLLEDLNAFDDAWLAAWTAASLAVAEIRNVVALRSLAAASHCPDAVPLLASLTVAVVVEKSSTVLGTVAFAGAEAKSALPEEAVVEIKSALLVVVAVVAAEQDSRLRAVAAVEPLSASIAVTVVEA
jgi:hypothetical protein